MASFKQLSKYNWKVQISLGYKDGKKQIVRKQGFKTKKEALAWSSEIENNKNKGYAPIINNNIPFNDFINKWYEDYKKLSIGVSTQASYIGRINTHILPKLGDYKLHEITNTIVQDFYNSLIKDGMKPSSAKKVFDILIGCFKYAKKQKLIIELPTDIDKIKAEKPSIGYWNKDEVDYFLEQLEGEYLHAPIFIDILTGLRVGELCGLRWGDIDLENGYINIRNQVIRDNQTKSLILTSILKTSTSYRNISIPNVLISYIRNLYDDVKPPSTEFLIKTREGLMCNPRNISMDFSNNISKYKDSLEEKEEKKEDINNYMQLKQITFHGLRHTHATLLILNGENIKVVSDRLGHKDIVTTLQTYTHVMDDMKQNTAALLDNMFNK